MSANREAVKRDILLRWNITAQQEHITVTCYKWVHLPSMRSTEMRDERNPSPVIPHTELW